MQKQLQDARRALDQAEASEASGRGEGDIAALRNSRRQLAQRLKATKGQARLRGGNSMDGPWMEHIILAASELSWRMTVTAGSAGSARQRGGVEGAKGGPTGSGAAVGDRGVHPVVRGRRPHCALQRQQRLPSARHRRGVPIDGASHPSRLPTPGRTAIFRACRSSAEVRTQGSYCPLSAVTAVSDKGESKRVPFRCRRRRPWSPRPILRCSCWRRVGKLFSLEIPSSSLRQCSRKLQRPGT